jgi:hypothetical protein
VLHSCLSDEEDEVDRDGGEVTFGRGRGRGTWNGFEGDGSEEVEEYMLRRSAEWAKENRSLGRERT